MSGIYIPGVEMPTNCCECFAFKSNADGYLFCKAKRIAFGKEDAEWLPLKTPNWCPLIPVPEHGRLIDADALRQDWLENGENEYVYDTNSFLDSIDFAPTIIPADPAEEGEG